MNRLLLPAQALCLAALHFAFAFSRFVSLLVEFGSRLGLVQPSERWGRRRGDGSGNGERIRDELNRGRWTKTPKHLAINFVRSTPVHVGFGRSTGNRAALEKRELVKLVEDIESVVEWSGEVGIEVLTLYDEYGLVETNATLVEEALSNQAGCTVTRINAPTQDSPSSRTPPKSQGVTSFELDFDKTSPSTKLRAVETPEIVAMAVSRLGKGDRRRRIDLKTGEQGIGREIDSGCGSSEVDDLMTSKGALSISTPSSTPSVFDSPIPTASVSSISSPPTQDVIKRTPSKLKLKINLISKSSGRDHLAVIARELGRGVQRGSLDLESVDVNAVEERMEASSISDPDLLIVLGGPYLRLKGFPPWQLRLTEMYHHSSPSWLPSPRINSKIFLSALDVYGGAEMRLGR